MADIESNIDININANNALAALKQLQAQISAFHQAQSKLGLDAQANSSRLASAMMQNINNSGKFIASMKQVQTSTESFTTALEKNKLSMGEYFRYAGSQVTGFRKIFSTEFDTIDKVARERVKTLQTQYIKMGRDANGAMQAISVRPLALDMNDLGTKVAITAQKQQIMNQLLKQGSTEMLNFGKNTQWAGRQLMVGFTVPLSIFGAAAAREFMKIEEQVVKFKRVYGDAMTPTADTDKMISQVRDLATEFTKYGVAVDKTMGIAAEAAAMGKTGADLLAQVSQASKLAVLGGVDQKQALETTISLTNAFGVSADQLSSKINFLNAVENQTVTSIEDLTTAVPIAAPVIQELGGSIEDLTFFLTAMKEGGIDASEGANALKSGLASLINPSAEATQMLSELGINLEGIVQQNAGNVKQTIIDFGTALDQLQPLQRAQAIEQLFGKFQFARMSTLFQNVIAEGSQANRVLEVTKQSTAALAVLSEREMKRVEDSPMYKFQKSIEQFQAAMAPVGETFLKAVTPIIDFGTKILEKFNEMDEGAKQIIAVLVAAVAGVGPVLLMGFGLVSNGIANLVKGFLFFGSLLGKLSGQSTTVGQSLAYMTESQLQAASVAASLNQVHQSLHQTFTSETSAVNQLASAYRSATAAQQGMSMPMLPRSVGKKFSTGGMVSGPGTGTSDSIPAMLSHGEAVIPAKSVARFPGLISGLISGNIPGFADGLHFAHIGGGQRVSPAAAMDASGRDYTGKAGRGISILADLGIEDELIRILHSWGAEIQSGVNTLLGKASGASVGSVAGQFAGGKAASLQRWNQTMKLAGADPSDSELVAQFQNYDKAMSAKLKSLQSSGVKAIVDTEEMLMQIPVSERKMYRSLESLDQEVIQEIGGQNKKLVAVRSKALNTVRDVRIDIPSGSNARALVENDPEAKKLFGRQASSKTGRVRYGISVQSSSPGGMGDFGTADVEAIERKTKQRRMAEARAESAWQDQYAASNTAGRRKLTAQKATFITETADLLEQEIRETRNQKARAKRQADQNKVNADREIKQSQQDGQIQRDARIQARQGRAIKAGAIGFAASSIVGMASMVPGVVGETAQNIAPAVMGISSLLPLLAGLPAPIALVAAGLVGLGFVLKGLYDNMVKARDEATKFAETMGSGRKAIDKMAEFTGTVNPSAEMFKTRQAARAPYEIVAGKETWGGQFLQSDTGKDMVTQAQEGIAKSSTKDVASKLANQFATEIAAGVLSKEQAISLAMNLGTELNNLKLTTDINAKMVELLGPDGQDLLKDPISVQVKLVQDAAKQSAAPGGSESRIISELQNFWTDYNNLAAAEADYAVSIKSTAESAQLALDTAEKAHIARLEEAKAGGDVNKVNEEQNRWMLEKQRLSESNTKAFEKQLETLKKLEKGGIEAQRSGDQIVENMQQNLIKGTAEGSAARTRMTSVTNNIADNINLHQAFGSETNTVKAQLLAMVSVDNMELFQNLQNTFPIDKSPRQWRMIAEIGTTLGAGDMESLMNTINMFDDKAMKESVIQRIVDIKDQDPAAASQAIQNMQSLSLISESLPEGDKMQWDIYINPKTGEFTDAYNTVMGQIASLQAVAAGGPINVEMMASIITNPDAYAELVAQSSYFMGLPPEQRVLFMESYLKVVGQIKPEEIDAYRAKLGAAGVGKSDAAVGSMMGIEAGKSITTQALAKPKLPAPTPQNQNTGGSGTQSSILDDLTKKLKQVQDATIKVTEGWAASRKALDNLFPGGASYSPFNGIEQSMRRLGAKEDLIKMIAGMDPKEFEKRKNELFTFDGAGNIAGFRDSLLSVGSALRSISFGEFQSKQQATINTTNDQATAVRKLVANGISLADAYEIAKDATMAQSIAQEGNNDIIRQATEQYHAAASAAKDYAAAAALVSSNEQAASKADVIKWLTANKNNFTNAQREAILGNADLARIAMNPSIDPAALQAALDNAANGVQFKISEQMLTITGLETIFNDGFNKAMEAFSAQEKKIELQFAVKKEPLENVVKIAEQTISDIQNRPGGLDDLQAELDRISLKEQDINKAYDVRIKALDIIQASNEAITRQQKSQLSIAEALSQGDIASAARAAQELQAQQAADAVAQQRKMLDDARQLEIARITGEMGLTRTQIDTQIRDLNAQILNIQETQVEPVKYQLEILDRQKQSQIEALRVLGLSRQQWEAIKNRIDVAKTSSKEYEDAMKLARNVVSDILNYWTEIQKPKTTEHTIITRHIDIYGNGNVDTSNDQNTGPGPGPGSEPTPEPSPAPGTLTPAQISSVNLDLSNAVDTVKSRERARADYASAIWPPFWAKDFGPYDRRIEDAKNAAEALREKIRAGGGVPRYAMGGLVSKLFQASGTDTIPAMLSPGEFVIRKSSVDSFGASNLKAINNGTFDGGSVYNNNYSVNISVGGSNNSAKDIANAVISEIKQIDSQRVRGNRLSYNV